MKSFLPRFELGLVIFSVGWVMVAIAVSCYACDWMWFARAGAILCFTGAAIPIGSLLRRSSEDYAKENPGLFGFASYSDWPPKKAVLNARITRLGFWLGGIGTVIWAYGDWLGAKIYSFTP